MSPDGNNNRTKTLASFVVICEFESFVTTTVITARCVGTDLITSSVVLKTFVYICIIHTVHTLYTTVRMCMPWCFHSHKTVTVTCVHRGCTWRKKCFPLNNLPPKMAATFQGLITNAHLITAGMSYSYYSQKQTTSLYLYI